MTQKNQLQRLSYARVTWRSREFLHYVPFYKVLKNAIKLYGRGDILDIGCGNKPYESLFNGDVQSYIGVDIEQSHLNKVDIICEATKIPLENSTFDTVICTQTIEHVFDHGELLQEAFRLLRQGGHLILSGPFYWPLHEEPFDFFRFTRYGFQKLVTQSGLSVISIEENGGSWSMSGQALILTLCTSRLWLLRIIFSKFRFYIFINILFGFLDYIDYNKSSTTNYVVVAKKL